MKKYLDEIVLILGWSIAYLFLILVRHLEWLSLWFSLVVLMGITLYYSTTFFKAKNPFQKLLFFGLSVPLLIIFYALVYKAFGLIDTSTGEHIIPDWMNAIYFSVVTWTTLGYGDFKPIDPLKPWVMAEALMGYLFMGLLVGKVIHLSQKTQSEQKK